MKEDLSDKTITIYFIQRNNFAFTPFFYDLETYRGVCGSKKNIEPVAVMMKEDFNEYVTKSPDIYQSISVKRSAFEKLYQAANKRDRESIEKIIKEEFPPICQ